MTSNELQLLVSSLNGFSMKLYQTLAGTADSDVFFSPVSIFTALAMTSVGARSNTSSQMKEVLNITNIQDRKLHKSFGSLSSLLSDRHALYDLRFANRLYIENECSLAEEFLSTIRTYYDGGVTKVDFKTASEGARTSINDWVESETNRNIKDLLQKGDIDSLTRLVIVNAVYFKGKWKFPFHVSETQDAPFHSSLDERCKVPMMSLVGSFPYDFHENLRCQILELPYDGGNLSMVLFLPEKIGGLATLEKNLNPDAFQADIYKLTKRRVAVYIPRFKMEESISLNSCLTSMGMADLFNEFRCDLSGICKEEVLSVSKVIHKAFVDVNEEGTEAAAATTVMMCAPLCALPSQPIIFRADHPFLFIIRDCQSHTILFLGRTVFQPFKN